MISVIDKPNEDSEIYHILNPLVKKWFSSKFPSFALPQKYGVMPIHCRENILISSPTGSGKTLTAFLSVLNDLVDNAEKGILENKVYCIYISPLKALGSDIKHNLLRPLEEMEEIAGKKFGIKVSIRTGDTTAYEKQKMLKTVPHILITTPESLALMLASPKFKENIQKVDWVIIDEIHAMAENKRGAHLSLFLEHLQHYNPGMARVGLSATVSPLDEVAKYLVGTNRDCKVVDISYIKQLDLKVISPVEDLVNTDYHHIQEKTYHLLNDLIQSHKTTLVFTNTRSATERIVHTLKQKFPKSYVEISEETDNPNLSLIGAHHGSLSKDHRFDIEQKLRDGKLKAVVCSTSLELGIDIGSIDLVILLGSPKSVARALQRSGRSGHKLHATTKARLIVTDRDDLIECAVLLKNALEHKIDTIRIPKNSLDVLVQHVLGFVLSQDIDVDELYEITKRSYCYENLNYDEYLEVIRYLCGSFPALENSYIFAKMKLENNILSKRGKMTRVLYCSNLGTIPSSGGILVKIGEYPIGMIDEGFLEKLKKGDTFVLGGDVYEFNFARGMTAQVIAANHRTPTVPRWFSETLPLSFDLANCVQHLRGKMHDAFIKREAEKSVVHTGSLFADSDSFLKMLHDYLYVDENAAKAIFNYNAEQYLFNKQSFPKNDNFVVEIFYDDIFNTHKHYHIFHSLNGRRVNEALSRVFAYILGRYHHLDIEVGLNDNGFYLAANKTIEVARLPELLEEHDFRKILEYALENTEILRRRFRHCAERSFMILRSYMGHKRRLGNQQVSSQILLKAARKISPDFIILKEAQREVMEDLMDVYNAKKVAEKVKIGRQKLSIFDMSMPSPFAMNLVLQGYSDIIAVEDRHRFLQNMHMLVMAKISKHDSGAKLLGANFEGGIDTPKLSSFNYEKYWEDKQKEKEDVLRKELIYAFQCKKTPVDVKLDVLHCLENPEKKLNEKSADYFKQEFSGVVDAIWTDKIVFTLKKMYW